MLSQKVITVEFSRLETMINDHLKEGWYVKQMVSESFQIYYPDDKYRSSYWYSGDRQSDGGFRSNGRVLVVFETYQEIRDERINQIVK